ncbi:ABC transporter ATP-binding protein [Ferrovibrio sp.]|uniref:ABC transporter ATP-binding protein n=1 Tax=Ferrovibrio sp. TaxID=1917215 RepID=UPI0025C3F8E0|nr:ABC transporter ATP-binding protein [Ferrovibrio sp.]MBX3454672.1 ABC transporter ATP-binding protein [Ferrovibrio sp.]
MNATIVIQGVDVFHGQGAQRFHAVKQASLSIAPRETFGLVGGSGSGKSSLLRVLAGLSPNWSGSITMAGEAMPPGQRPPRAFHRHVQMVFQDPYASLNPRHTVDRILSEGLALHGFRDAEQRIRDVLDQVGLGPRFRFRYPHELSGGQRQRVAIARAISLEPQILLLDEPTSALDASVQAEILNLLMTIRQQRPVTCVFVSHDLAVIAHICDRVAVMQHGSIVEHLTADELISRQVSHPYTRQLLAASEGLSGIDPAA